MSEGTLPAGWWIGAALLLLLQLLLSTSLVSLSALSRVAVHRLAAEHRRYAWLVELKGWPSMPRMVCQFLRQASLLGASWMLGVSFVKLELARPWLVGALLALLLGVVLIEVLLARWIALRDPRRALRWTSPFVRLLLLPVYPLAAPLGNWLSRTAARVEASNGADEREDTQDEEVEALIEAGEREGILEAAEGEMIRSIADLDDTLVREIMTPRTDIVSIPTDYTVSQARKALLGAAHSRLPVFQGSSDNVTGVLHARDLFRAWEDGRDADAITGFLRPAMFVPETLTVAETLKQMRLQTRIAMVIDEYGGIAGLVTLEDVLEEIVGDIRDEHDLEDAEFHVTPDGGWVVAGTAQVKDFEDLVEVDVGERDFDTVAGLVVSRFGRVPREGQTLTFLGLRFEVLQADARRVYRVKVDRERRDSGAA